MIISASRRTDIPRWYAPWLMQRIRAGDVMVRNPMNAAQAHRVPLSPEHVDCIVFWSKDPQPLLGHLDALDHRGFSYYFQFTLTPYGREWEKNLRPKSEILQTFQTLSHRIGKRRVVWRYDPILLAGPVTISWHAEQLARYCDALADATDTVVISFVDEYAKLRGRGIRALTAEERMEAASRLAPIAHAHGLRIVTCAEAGDYSAYGIGRSACVDPERIEKICGMPLRLPRESNQRPHCGCCKSVDIGAYHSCPSGCVYCYANASEAAALRNFRAHDQRNEMLLDSPTADMQVFDCKEPGCRQQQTSFL